ncbi:hypothetical protein [Salmonella phage SD-1_S14]|nr:hypothetical protein [Salmonella phage SD-2_S15]WPK19168.1 hypothetical protein [Salmonella phage SD-6_S16]WPK19837.1 hypothetical protein [Salmonella phage SD-1_S14]
MSRLNFNNSPVHKGCSLGASPVYLCLITSYI